ncbi:MAG: glucose-6-phosphate isomerase, partial [Hyphomicrobiales bacterium]
MATSRKSLLNSLMKHRKRLEAEPMRVQFALDPNRFKRFSVAAGDILLDYSKNRIDEAVMEKLFEIAGAADLEARRKEMWAGKHINSTEDRAVMHMALRYQGDKPVKIDGVDVMPEVRTVLAAMKNFSEAVRSGAIRGATGEQFTDVVNMGIGGSDLGPAMVTLALAPYTRPDLRVHYVSNVDGAHIHDTLKGLDPKTTMFIVASKTFTTDETMT